MEWRGEKMAENDRIRSVALVDKNTGRMLLPGGPYLFHKACLGEGDFPASSSGPVLQSSKVSTALISHSAHAISPIGPICEP